MNAGIHIGATEGAVKVSRETIMEIIRCSEADSAVKVQALITLRTMTSVKNVTVKDCEIAVVAEPKQSDSIVDEVSQASDEQKAVYDKAREVWNQTGDISSESLGKGKMDWSGAKKSQFCTGDCPDKQFCEVEKSVGPSYYDIWCDVHCYLQDRGEVFRHMVLDDQSVWAYSDGHGVDYIAVSDHFGRIVRIPNEEHYAANVVWFGRPADLLERLKVRYETASV